jgi:hypothetical protein
MLQYGTSMKIDKILFTCNENEEYIDFWNCISKYFKEKIQIEPILYFMGNVNNYNISDKYGEVRRIEPVPRISTRIQALWGKFYFTRDEPDTTWIIGDLDLFHFNKEYFTIEGDYEYAHLNENGYYNKASWKNNTKIRLPGYYHVAKGSIFSKIFNLQTSFQDHVTNIQNSNKYGVGFNELNQCHNGIDGQYQCCEEDLSTEILRNQIIHHNLSFYGKTLPSHARLDREQIMLPFDMIKRQIQNKQIVDMHCPRPYKKYQKRIEEILSLV